MKKAIAFVLAILMMLTCVAFAEGETAPAQQLPRQETLYLSDLEISMIQGEQKQTATLTDLVAAISVGLTEDGVPVIPFALTKGEDVLLEGFMAIQDGKAYMKLEGMDRAIPVEVEEQASQGLAMLAPMLQSAEATGDVHLPVFEGLPIPKMNMLNMLSSFAGETVTGEDGKAVTEFMIPYAVINQILAQVLQAVQESGMLEMIPVEGLGDVGAMAAQLNQSTSGITLYGKVEDDAESEYVYVEAYAVTENEPSEQPVLLAEMNSVENDLTFAAYVPDEQGNTQQVGQAELLSEPEKKELKFDLSAMGFSFSFGLSPVGENGQGFSLAFDGQGEKGDIYMYYIEHEKGLEFTLSFNMGDQMKAALYLNPQEKTDELISTDVTLDITSGMQNLVFDGAVDIEIDHAFLESVLTDADTAPLTQEEAMKLQQQMNDAMQKVTEYLNSVEPAA